MGRMVVVVGDGQMLQTDRQGLLRQGIGGETAVTVGGVSMEVVAAGTTVGTDLP